MNWLDKWNSKIESASQHTLETGFRQLVDMEVELERKLKDVREAKARFMVEIDLRINSKNDH